MNKENLQEELTKKQQTLEALVAEIATAERELESRMETFSRLQGEYIGQSKKPASLAAQKRRIADVQADIAGLNRLRERNEKDIQVLEKDLGLCRLHDDQVTRFTQALSRCQGACEILAKAETLNQEIQNLTGAAETLFVQTETAIGSLAAAFKELPLGYSFQAFLDGELLTIEPGAEDRDGILEKIGQELKGIARTGLAIDLRAAERLLEVARLYPQWQTRIGEFSDGRNLVLTRQSLKPKLPHKTMESSSMLPPNYADVKRHPKRYSGRDFQNMKRAEGVAGDTDNFGTFMEDTYNGTY